MHYRRISADCHLDMPWMPPELFVENAPRDLKERMPYVEDGPDGPQWVAKNGANFGLMNGVGPGGAKHVPGQNVHIPDQILFPGGIETACGGLEGGDQIVHGGGLRVVALPRGPLGHLNPAIQYLQRRKGTVTLLRAPAQQRRSAWHGRRCHTRRSHARRIRSPCDTAASRSPGRNVKYLP